MDELCDVGIRTALMGWQRGEREEMGSSVGSKRRHAEFEASIMLHRSQPGSYLYNPRMEGEDTIEAGPFFQRRTWGDASVRKGLVAQGSVTDV